MTEGKQIRICHLYPDLMNMYGDRGNVIALADRCRRRGLPCQIDSISRGEMHDADRYDIVFFGGGQDHDQETVYDDLMNVKADTLRHLAAEGTVFLCICGGYQLMGEYYSMINGHRIEGLSILDLHTDGDPGRLIGNLVCDCGLLTGVSDPTDSYVVGFENHSGRTKLGPGVEPLAKVVSGYGNNGVDGTEGAVKGNIFCSYSHGSLLPKNYRLTDLLLERAIERRYGTEAAGEIISAVPDSSAEERARLTCIRRFLGGDRREG